jgi:hypothetical protein
MENLCFGKKRLIYFSQSVHFSPRGPRSVQICDIDHTTAHRIIIAIVERRRIPSQITCRAILYIIPQYILTLAKAKQTTQIK